MLATMLPMSSKWLAIHLNAFSFLQFILHFAQLIKKSTSYISSRSSAHVNRKILHWMLSGLKNSSNYFDLTDRLNEENLQMVLSSSAVNEIREKLRIEVD